MIGPDGPGSGFGKNPPPASATPDPGLRRISPPDGTTAPPEASLGDSSLHGDFTPVGPRFDAGLGELPILAGPSDANLNPSVGPAADPTLPGYTRRGAEPPADPSSLQQMRERSPIFAEYIEAGFEPSARQLQVLERFRAAYENLIAGDVESAKYLSAVLRTAIENLGSGKECPMTLELHQSQADFYDRDTPEAARERIFSECVLRSCDFSAHEWTSRMFERAMLQQTILPDAPDSPTTAYLVSQTLRIGVKYGDSDRAQCQKIFALWGLGPVEIQALFHAQTRPDSPASLESGVARVIESLRAVAEEANRELPEVATDGVDVTGAYRVLQRNGLLPKRAPSIVTNASANSPSSTENLPHSNGGVFPSLRAGVMWVGRGIGRVIKALEELG